MGTFDFIVKNSKTLAELDINKDGCFNFEFNDFDFSYPDLAVTCEDGFLMFNVTAGEFELMCMVESHDIPKAIDHISRISSATARRNVIEALEGEFREDTEALKKDAEDALAGAQVDFDEAKQNFDEFLDAMRRVKGAWGIS